MKTLFIIPLHSQVDLITNSSSELFVCNTDKTIETVKEILQSLLDTHNKLSNTNFNYNDIFGEIKISEYEYDYNALPQNLRDEYEKYEDNPTLSYWSSSEGYRMTHEYQDLQRKENILLTTIVTVKYEDDKGKYDVQWTEFCKQRDKLWKKWNERGIIAKNKILIYWMEQNKIKKTCINFIKKNIKRNYFYNTKFNEIITEFEVRGLYYGIKMQKGNILISSKNDNSIPYELQVQIESYLGKRYHLG